MSTAKCQAPEAHPLAVGFHIRMLEWNLQYSFTSWRFQRWPLGVEEECLTWIQQGKYLGRKEALLNLEKELLRRVELVRFVRLCRELDFQRALYALELPYSKSVIFSLEDQAIHEKCSTRKRWTTSINKHRKSVHKREIYVYRINYLNSKNFLHLIRIAIYAMIHLQLSISFMEINNYLWIISKLKLFGSIRILEKQELLLLYVENLSNLINISTFQIWYKHILEMFLYLCTLWRFIGTWMDVDYCNIILGHIDNQLYELVSIMLRLVKLYISYNLLKYILHIYDNRLSPFTSCFTICTSKLFTRACHFWRSHFSPLQSIFGKKLHKDKSEHRVQYFNVKRRRNREKKQWQRSGGQRKRNGRWLLNDVLSFTSSDRDGGN